MHPEFLSMALFWIVAAYTPGPNNAVASYSGFNFGIRKTIPHIFGVTFGLLWLSTVPPTNGIVAQIFGTKYLSTLFGIVFLCHQFGAFAGAFLGGYFYDVYGSYDYAWYMAIVLSIFATAVHFPIDETRLVRVDKPT